MFRMPYNEKLHYLSTMSFVKTSATESSVYICNFECFIHQVNVEMKFPCAYFVQWRTINSKIIAETQRYQPQHNRAVINERIRLNIQMIYDNEKQQFSQRQTIIELFLVSKSRPDQVRMVGRISIDVSKVINVGMYSEPTIFQLNFSSVQGTIVMQFKTVEQVLTSMSIHSLDKSSFAEYITRNDFKSHNKYESIVLARHQNKSHERNSLEKTRISDVRLYGKNDHSEKMIFRASVLNQSLFQSKEVQNGQCGKRINSKQENSSKTSLINQSRVFQEINHSFAKNNNDNWIIKEEGQAAKLRNQLSDAKLKLSRYEGDIAAATQSINSKNTQISELKQALTKKMEELASRTEANQELECQVAKLKGEIRQLKNINMKHSRLNEQLSAEMRSVTQQNIRNKLTIKSLVSELKDVAEYNNQLKKQAGDLSQLNLELREKVSLVKTQQFQMEKLRDQLKCELIKNERLNHFKNRGDSLELQNMLLAERLKEEQRNGQSYESKFTELQQLVVKLESANEKCNQRVRQSEQIELELRSKLEELQIENNQLVTSLQNQRQQVRQGLNSQIQTLRAENLVYKEEASLLKIELLNARNSLEENRCAEQEKAKLMKKCETYEEAIGNLHANLEDEIGRNHELNKQIIGFTERQASLRDNLRLLENESISIVAAFREREQNEKKLKQVIESLKNKLKQQVIVEDSHQGEACREKSEEYWHQRAELLKKRKQLLEGQKSLLMSSNQVQTHQKELKNHIRDIILKRSKSRSALEDRIKDLTSQLNTPQVALQRQDPAGQQAIQDNNKGELV